MATCTFWIDGKKYEAEEGSNLPKLIERQSSLAFHYLGNGSRRNTDLVGEFIPRHAPISTTPVNPRHIDRLDSFHGPII